MRPMFKRFLFMQFRRRRRWRPGNGLFVVLGVAAGRHQIDDIGMGGLSFHYVDNGLPSKHMAFDLKIVSEIPPTALQMEGKTVSDTETGELIFQRKRIKRRGIRFERISRQQRRQLKTLISTMPKK